MVKCLSTMWEVGDLGSIPGSGRSPGEGNGNQLFVSWQFFFFFLQQVVSWRSSSESVSLKCTQSSIWIMSTATSGGSLESIL